MKANVLEIKNLSVAFDQKNRIVDGVSFFVRQAEIVGIVGESGSGKTMTALSLLGLLPENGRIEMESMIFDGQERKPIKGKEISIVFQEPMTSLNPVLTIEKQVSEILILHENISKQEILRRIRKMFHHVGLDNTAEFLHKYPHELSGGQRQRVMLAMAMICKPRLLIADEPTTALDSSIQEQILDVIQKLNQEFGVAVLLISHDINLVRRFCDYVLVMENGKIVENGDAKEVFHNPQSPYTKELLKALPSKEKRAETTKGKETVLEAEELSVSYGTKTVVERVSFTLKEGEVLGIMGNSGCGKSTLSQALIGLLPSRGLVRTYHNRIGMVFQDPYGSLNPAKTVEWILEEPLRIQKIKKEERKKRVAEMIQEVGLTEDHLKRKADRLSGGQRQRVAIACALMTYPEILILDEPVSALDVSVQDKICRLLEQCKRRFHLSYLFISHDREVMEMMCDRILIMDDGKILE